MRWILLVAAVVVVRTTYAQVPDFRASLTLPDPVWSDALAAVQAPGPGLGYSGEVMRSYKYDAHALRTVGSLFRDVRGVPRYTGKVSDDLLAAAGDPGALVWLGYTLTDISAGRNLPTPPPENAGEPIDWRVEWLENGTATGAAAAAAIERLGGGPEPLPQGFEQLPHEVQRLIARLLIAVVQSRPSFDCMLRGDDSPAGANAREAHDLAYRLATAPWIEERWGQFVTDSAESFRLLESFDRRYLAFGSVVFARYAWAGIAEYLAWEGRGDLPDLLRGAKFAGVTIRTPLGEVVVLGPDDDDYDGAAPLLVLDTGGDDHYTGYVAVSSPGRSPVGLLVDLGGNDQYVGETAAMACGLFGLGAIFDLGGDDRYAVLQSGLGAGHFGTGLLYDAAGDDVYTTRDRFSQGAAIAGLGMLIDRGGDDQYTCGQLGQGLGGTLGAGVLLDSDGNDTYTARDDGNISELYEGQSVAMSQGCGWGRRADFGDGHTLAGGVGALIDAAGDDAYSAQVWAQGCAYWWSLGFLEDRAGNDTYRNGKYSAGAAAHFSIGSCVDLAGDDRHNLANETAKNQYHAHARDGSIAVLFDGAGDDAYMLRNHCGGSGDLGSIALFWDRSGDDVYTLKPGPVLEENGWNNTPPLGTSTWYKPMRTVRDDIGTYGLFFDTGGSDRYEGSDPRQGQDRPGDSRAWTMFHPWASWGYGIDLEVP